MKISKLLVVSALVCFTTNALYSMETIKLSMQSTAMNNPLANVNSKTNIEYTNRGNTNTDTGKFFANDEPDPVLQKLATSIQKAHKSQKQVPFEPSNTADGQLINEFNNNNNMQQNQVNPYESNNKNNEFNNNPDGWNNPFGYEEFDGNVLQQTTIVQPYNRIMTSEQNQENDLSQSVNKLSQIQANLRQSISSHNNAMIQISEAALATLLMHLAQARKTCDDIDENVKKIFNNCDYLNLDTYYKSAKLDDGGRYDNQDIYNFITSYLQQQVSNSNTESKSDYKKVVQFMLEWFSYQNFRQAYYSVVNDIRDLITKSILQFKSKSNLYNETPLMRDLLAYIHTDGHNVLDKYETLRELVIKNNYDLDLGASVIQQWYNGPIPCEQQQYLIPREVISALTDLSNKSFDTTLIKLSQPLSVGGISAISGIKGVIGLMQRISNNLRTAMSNHIISKQSNITESNIFGLDTVKEMFPHSMQRKAVLAHEFKSGSVQASVINNEDNNVVESSKKIPVINESPVTTEPDKLVVNPEISKNNDTI
jgi:hypothetical protein